MGGMQKAGSLSAEVEALGQAAVREERQVGV